jgi:hypothetical protein
MSVPARTPGAAKRSLSLCREGRHWASRAECRSTVRRTCVPSGHRVINAGQITHVGQRYSALGSPPAQSEGCPSRAPILPAQPLVMPSFCAREPAVRDPFRPPDSGMISLNEIAIYGSRHRYTVRQLIGGVNSVVMGFVVSFRSRRSRFHWPGWARPRSECRWRTRTHQTHPIWVGGCHPRRRGQRARS